MPPSRSRRSTGPDLIRVKADLAYRREISMPMNRRPSTFAFAASRRRRSSSRRTRLLPSFSRRTRFSSRRYSITCCYCRDIQPATITANSGHGAIRIQPAYLWPGLPISAVHSLPTVPYYSGSCSFTVRANNETIRGQRSRVFDPHVRSVQRGLREYQVDARTAIVRFVSQKVGGS